MATFIGLDLAWKETNESGICWLEGTSPEALRCTRIETAARPIGDLADEIAAVDGAVVVAIDAPVLCTPHTNPPQSSGQPHVEPSTDVSALCIRPRWVDPEIGRQFHPHKVSAYPASRAVANGWTAGIDLGRALHVRGFTLDPAALTNCADDLRVAVEVYPHTIHVRLFGLDERLPYKKGKGRRVADRRQAMQRYQRHLYELADREVPGILGSPELQRVLAPKAAETATVTVLDQLDDTLDGVTCALAAWLLWRRPDAWETIGDLNGYIQVPRKMSGK